ncbi:unnamed protein product, partial [Choristocarpus tenellus]
MSVAERRVKKELQKLRRDPLDGITVEVHANDPKQWIVTIIGAGGTVFEGETYRLNIKFPPNYPIESPEVVFV